MAHRLNCSVAWGIFLDQESNLCPLHWQGILKHWTTKRFLLDGFVFFFFLISLIAFLNVFLHTYHVLKLNIQKTKIMVSSPIMSWQTDGETMQTVTDFFSWASKSLQMVTATMKLKRCLVLGRKAMTSLDSILKRDITLPTKVYLVKAMVFPVVMHGCESWTIKKAEC